MDCCNYMQYRNHQPYSFGPEYYDNLPDYNHASDFYGHHLYHDYYNSPYYPPQWSQVSPFPDYVYNPKEARIRKAMREATRDRSIGASPMLPRPRSRLPSHADWTQPQEQLMMSSMDGMRRIDPPLCSYPMSNTETNQHLPMSGYNKMDSPSMMPNYMQLSPLAQLQQQTEMWHPHQENIRPRSLGTPYHHTMMPEIQSPPTYHTQELQETPTNLIMDKPRQSPGCNPRSLPDGVPSQLIPEENTHSIANSQVIIAGQTVPADQPESCQQLQPTNPPHYPADKNMRIMAENNQDIEKQYIPGPDPAIGCNTFERLSKVESVTVAKKPRGRPPTKKSQPPPPPPKSLPDFNEAFGTTERGRFLSPPDPRLSRSYLDLVFNNDNNSFVKFDDFQIQ